MTTQKHRNFISEPMGEKPVTALAGIGEVLGGRLTLAGCDKASVVLGKFLLLDKDRVRFESWLHSVSNANSKQAGDCYLCLQQWCVNFL